MKYLLVVCSLACAYAAVVPDSSATVLKSEFQSEPEGNINYAFETDKGIFINVNGKVNKLGPEELAPDVFSVTQYQSADGENDELKFVANQDWYQPQGAHLPTTPAPTPYPDYIARALKYIAEHPYVESLKP